MQVTFLKARNFLISPLFDLISNKYFGSSPSIILLIYLDPNHMKKLSLSLLAATLLTTTTLHAQETENSFTYLGGMASFTGSGGYYAERSQTSAGIEGLYLKKVWGRFALGINASYSIALPKNESGHQAAQTVNTGVIPAYDWTRKENSQNLTLSLLTGFIIDHDTGSRTALTFGPTIGVAYSSRKGTFDLGGQPLPANVFIDDFDNKRDNSSLGLSLGAYHQLANSRWTFGAVGNLGLGTTGSDSVGVQSTFRVSVGYSF